MPDFSCYLEGVSGTALFGVFVVVVATIIIY